MGPEENTLRSLRQAVELSPKNGPLRRAVADLLRQMGRFEEAGQEYREALSCSPADAELLAQLAENYLSEGKHSEAAVILESLVCREDVPAKAYLLRARMQLEEGEQGAATRSYLRARELDPELGRRQVDPEPEVGFEAEEFDDQQEAHPHQRLRAAQEADTGEPDLRLERPVETFADVGGLDEIREEIAMRVLRPLQRPDLFAAFDRGVGGGILLYGAPGCGKTHLARATAGEVGAGFLSVSASDVLDLWMGQSERNLHALFELARESAPCVLFFDEVDALGASRSDVRHQSIRQVVNQLLTEMDGVGRSNEGVLVLAATSAPWHLDSAFLRPGRFDRILFVPPPDERARAEVLSVLCRKVPTAELDFQRLAAATGDFSGADLRGVLDLAVDERLREALSSGGPARELTTTDLLAAARRVRSSMADWFAGAKNHVIYGNQGGLYDDLLPFLK